MSCVTSDSCTGVFQAVVDVVEVVSIRRNETVMDSDLNSTTFDVCWFRRLYMLDSVDQVLPGHGSPGI